MEITRNNFKEKISLIRSAIDDATFLAIDGEFTGLNEEFNLNAYDTLDQRYVKVKEGSVKFLMIQFGLCAFKYDPENDTYSHKAFNFYIFPRSTKGFDPRFMCQTSSIEFLLAQGFDFSKVFQKGIPYLTLDAEDKIRKFLDSKKTELEVKLAEENESSGSTGDGPKTAADALSPGEKVPKDHQIFIDETHGKILDFLTSYKDNDSLRIPCPNRYRRRLVYEMVENEFSSNKELNVETVFDDKKNAFLEITVRSREEKQKQQRESMNEKYNELDDTVGFSKIIRYISQSQKLVVGHNMLLDILHTSHQFLNPLPPNLEEFKESIGSVFPKVIDTKVIVTTKPYSALFDASSLSDIMKRLKTSPFQPVAADPAEGFEGGYKRDSELLHEAGYDAYITGLCFLSLMEYMRQTNKRKKRVLPDNSLVQPFINKVFLMMCSDIPYLNLAGDDIVPNRDHVFHATFPKHWKTDNLLELFSPYGGSQISWLSDESAFVALRNINQAQNANSLTTRNLSGVSVLKYRDYQKMLNLKRKREISSNGQSENMPLIPKKPKMDESIQEAVTVSGGSEKKKVFEEDNTWT